jgi:hypothetical protein
VISRTDLRAVEIIGTLERKLGEPMVTSNQAMIFCAARRLGIDLASVPAYGRLPSSDEPAAPTRLRNTSPVLRGCGIHGKGLRLVDRARHRKHALSSLSEGEGYTTRSLKLRHRHSVLPLLVNSSRARSRLLTICSSYAQSMSG